MKMPTARIRSADPKGGCDEAKARTVQRSAAGGRACPLPGSDGVSRHFFTRFLHACHGATLAEFALVAPLFLLLTFAIIDNGLVLFLQTVLDNATRVAARQIEIGKVQLSDDKDGTGLFKTTLCNNLSGMIPCDSLQWRVQSSTTGFSSLSSAVTPDDSGRMTAQGFDAGTAQSYVLVQVGYTIPYMLPLLARLSSTTDNLLLVSTVAVQNERYQ